MRGISQQTVASRCHRGASARGRPLAAALGAACLAMAIVCGPCAAAAEGISLSAVDEPLASVLDRIGRQAGFTVVSEVPIDGTVTLSLEDAPLRRALARVLADMNHVLVYEDGQPRELRLYPGKGGAPVAKAPRREAPAARRPAARGPEDSAAALGVLKDSRASRVEKARALRVLADDDGPGAVAALMEALGAVESAGLAMGVIRALGRRSDDAAVAALAQIAEGGSAVSQRIAAVRALGNIDSDTARETLAGVAGGDDQVARAAQQSLDAAAR